MEGKKQTINSTEENIHMKEEIMTIPGTINPQIEEVKEINNPIQYDPKACIKKRLVDFIPQSKFATSVNKENVKETINFYMENRSTLMIYESSAFIIPPVMKEPYSDFSSWIASLKFNETIYTNTKGVSLVNSYETQSGEKYVIKKAWHYFDVDNQDIYTIEQLEEFIRIQFNKYTIMKIINGFPNKAQTIQFQIIHLPNIKYMVTELLMPFGGAPLTENIQKLSSEEIFEIVMQVTDILENLDSNNIELNHLKAENILIDSVFGKIIIRYVVFEIGRNILILQKSIQELFPDASSVYCSPEIYQFVTYLSEKIKSLDWRKSQMYSLGVLILLMCRYFPNEMSSDQFDKLKQTESSYKKFTAALSNSTQSIIDPLKKKLIKLAEICLSFIPEKRLSARELKGILKNLVNKNLEEISNEYSEIIHARSPIDASNVSV